MKRLVVVLALCCAPFVYAEEPISFSRRTSAQQPIGFTLSLVAGDGSEIVHAGEPDGGDAFRHVYQASLAYRLPIVVLLEAGVYPSHIGFDALAGAVVTF